MRPNSSISSTKFLRLDDIPVTWMDGDLVLLGIDSGMYFGISGIGPYVWALLEKPHSVTEVISHVSQKFAVEPSVCAQDMENFFQQLLEHNLIQIVGDKTKTV